MSGRRFRREVPNGPLCNVIVYIFEAHSLEPKGLACKIWNCSLGLVLRFEGMLHWLVGFDEEDWRHQKALDFTANGHNNHSTY